MDLGRKTTTYGTDDQSWLGSAHGTTATDTITLDVSLFDEATHYPDGWINSCVGLGKVAATGLYGPYDDAALDGRQVGEGVLYAWVAISSGNDVGAALMRHGKIRRSRMPANSGIDAAFEADVRGQIIFVD